MVSVLDWCLVWCAPEQRVSLFMRVKQSDLNSSEGISKESIETFVGGHGYMQSICETAIRITY